MSAETAADLRAAAEVLRRDGWTRGAWLDEGRRCVAGALTRAVMDLHPDDNFDHAYQAAHDALSVHIGRAPMLWNDAYGRTADEVIAALEAAADAAERKAAYDEGRWCGECMYGVVMDPPCCAQGPAQP